MEIDVNLALRVIGSQALEIAQLRLLMDSHKCPQDAACRCRQDEDDDGA